MSDLISRKAVYDILNGIGGCDAADEWANGWDKAIDTAIDELEEIPTAYDVDKVVEQLEEEWVDIVTEGDATPIHHWNGAIEKAIEVVKGAVKDE